DQPEEGDVEPDRLSAGGGVTRLVEPGGEPAPAEEDGADQHRRAGGNRQPDVSRVHEQEAAEQQLLDVRARVVNVARQNHAEGEEPDEDQRRQAVIGGAAPASEAPDGGGEGDGN